MDSYAARNCLRLGLPDLVRTTLTLAWNVSWEILVNQLLLRLCRLHFSAKPSCSPAFRLTRTHSSNENDEKNGEVANELEAPGPDGRRWRTTASLRRHFAACLLSACAMTNSAVLAWDWLSPPNQTEKPQQLKQFGICSNNSISGSWS